MIVVSNLFALQQALAPDADNPIFGMHNLLRASAIVADSALPNYPASNLANPATGELWKSASTATQYLTVSIDDVSMFDYAALARHNCGSGRIVVSLEKLVYELGDEWEEVVAPFLPADDSPIIMRVPRQGIDEGQLRWKFAPQADVPPQAAFASVGELLVMERSFPQEFTPLPHANRVEVTQDVSDGGELLGAIVLSETQATSISFQMLNDAWYRAKMAPFVKQANRKQPFFFAAQPHTQPHEAALAWFEEPAQPVFKPEFDAVDIALQLRAVS